MSHFTFTAILAVGLFGGMLIALRAGKWLGMRRKAAEGNGMGGIGVMEGAVFALMGLVIAFSFSGALTRFDWRRHLVIEEANDIGTAYLRVDLLPPQDQPAMRALFRRYVQTRLGIYEKLPDINVVNAELAKLAAIQGEMWAIALAGSQRSGTTAAPMLLLPALNAMFDILNTQVMAAKTHPPPVVFGMLLGLALVSSLLVGYDLARVKERHWIHLLGFTFAIAFSVYVILDLEYPRLGLIRIDDFDKALVDLLAQMK
ncbi:MAG: DUF4239 domain-containing protein [Candidatus Sumerlaeia bacterium]